MPRSPCPSVFDYEQEDNGDWSGRINVVILPSYQMPLKLSVEVTVAAYIRGDYAGKVILKGNKDAIAQKIFRGESVPISYKVLFPIPFPLPLVKRISLNQEVLCTGPEASGGVVTNIRLQHTLFPVAQLESGPPPPPPPPPEAVARRPAQGSSPQTGHGGGGGGQNHVSPDQCGRPVVPNLLVMNGLEPKRGEWPWLSALFMMDSTSGLFVFHCSGTLINHKHVVTAAHCVKYRERVELTTETLVVYLGKYNLEQVVEKESVYSELEEIHLHPDYDWKKYDADLAVLVLKTAVKYNSYIQPICLWNFSPDLDPIVGKLGTVVGWGRDEKGNQVTATPRMVRIPVVSQEDCLRSQPDFVLFTSSRTLCAGFRNGSGPCNGDSGGGLVIPMEDGLGLRWYLRGVVSLSLLDKSVYSCDLSQYVVYTDVAKYSDWLHSFAN
ncbi:serine protease gd-like isoform X2 [Bacillus rossius redtenbacheri]